MSTRKKRVYGLMLSLALALGVMMAVSLTVYAEEYKSGSEVLFSDTKEGDVLEEGVVIKVPGSGSCLNSLVIIGTNEQVGPSSDDLSYTTPCKMIVEQKSEISSPGVKVYCVSIRYYTLADPIAVPPEDVIASYGQTLNDVNMENPEGNTPGVWSWKDGSISVGHVGTHTFMAVFTPDDTNYKIKTNIKIKVTVDRAENPAIVKDTATVMRGGYRVDLADNIDMKSATGAVRYAISGPRNGCSLNGSVLTSGTNTGKVIVNVAVSGEDNYYPLDATPITVTITDNKQKVNNDKKAPVPAPKHASTVTSVTCSESTVSAKALNAAVTKAGGNAVYVKTISLGKNVKKISKSAFKDYKKATTLVVKTRKLKKANVKGSLIGSKISKVKVQVGSKILNKKYAKKYKKIFTKKNAGKKVKVK